MAYVSGNPKTKKAIKDGLAAGKKFTIISTGPFPEPTDGTVYIEGPHFPKPHTWYAQATVKDGVIISIK